MDQFNTSETKRTLEAIIAYGHTEDGIEDIEPFATKQLEIVIRIMSVVPSYYHEDILRAVLGLEKPQEGEASGDAE